MDDATAEKIARNNALFRQANEAIAHAATQHGLDQTQPTPFICECSDSTCTKIIRLSLDDYRRVRDNPRWFVHAPDHEVDVTGAVELLEEHETYAVVAKVGHAGRVASRLAASSSGD